MNRKKFKELTAAALDELPDEFQKRLENVDITVEFRPSEYVLAENNVDPDGTLLGLYRGVPLKYRGTGYGAVLPDIITIYQEPIVNLASGAKDVKQRIRDVLMHEIGHHFGMSEEELQ